MSELRYDKGMESLSWDQYFLNIATEVAKKSKDPSTKVGCVLVDKKKRVISVGYNGLIQGADESKMTLEKRPDKYYFSIHAEMNAILFAHRDLIGATAYTTTAPCDNCLKYCLQAGIKRFVYKEARVKSFNLDKEKTMSSFAMDEAIVRLLASVPEVETVNHKTGNGYVEDILASYEENSEEYKKLKSWIDK